jgi:hypothetical protein
MAQFLGFMDFEASSLHRGSFPVEIGWCSRDLLRGGSALIRPCAGWTEWSPASEATHGISLARLKAEGAPAAEAMRAANAELAGQRLISDNPSHDIKWLYVLSRGCGIEPTFAIDPTSLDALLVAAHRMGGVEGPEVHPLAAKRMADEAGVVAHRALDDAVMHALRLGAVAAAQAEKARGAAAGDALRAELVARARRLLGERGRK